MQTNLPDAVIFDLDGVLIDSIGPGYEARKAVLHDFGVMIEAVPDPHGENHKGASTAQLIAAVKQHTGVVIDHKEYAEKILIRIAEDLQQSGTEADPKLVELLHAIRDHHIPLAIASAGGRAGVEIKLRALKLSDAFDLIISADDVREHKPHPAAYLAVLDRLNARPGCSIVFEDSLAGVQAARAAGTKVVGFTKYSTPRQPLPGVAATINDWGETSLEHLCNLLA